MSAPNCPICRGRYADNTCPQPGVHKKHNEPIYIPGYWDGKVQYDEIDRLADEMTELIDPDDPDYLDYREEAEYRAATQIANKEKEIRQAGEQHR